MPTNRNSLYSLVKTVFIFSFLILILTFFKKDNFIQFESPHPDTLLEPIQEQSQLNDFTVTKGGITYNISPKYSYKISGVVVSHKNHSSTGSMMMHARAEDHINISDLCIVWGSNVTNLDLNAYEFWNGEFTCNIKTNNSAAWSKFAGDKLSNNHIITNNPGIVDNIRAVQIGDQIQVTGHLAEYSHNKGYRRGTSTIRTDGGNGACETIWVENFKILSPMYSLWRILYSFSLVLTIITAIAWISGVGTGYF